MSSAPIGQRNILVFGATSAIAQAVLRLMVARGASIYCVGRNSDKLEALLADLRVRAGPGQRIAGTTADLLEMDRHPALFAAADGSLGGLDAVLIAHGELPDQARCETSVQQAIDAIAVNATSAVSLLTLAASYFEPRGRGIIAAISSVAGDRGRGGNYVYAAGKSLLSTFLQGLRHRLTPRGIRVVTIKPGFVRTPMTARFEQSRLLWADPATVAQGIVRAMEKSNGEVYLPWFWYWIMLVLRHVPERLFLKLRF